MEGSIGRQPWRLADNRRAVPSLARVRFIPTAGRPSEPFRQEGNPGGEQARDAPWRRTASILIVEDDLDSREALADILSDEGYNVRMAANGLEALEILEDSLLGAATNAAPGVVLLDLMMPVMDGWEFLRRRQQDARLARIPVFVLSGAADLVEERTALDATLRFTKPIDLAALLSAIRRLCG